ncbi:hypothetical protein FBU30_009334 [Linnemannia zychae]|nr:hypothetical protein FBU30_009334 [Linnemannia zychae]
MLKSKRNPLEVPEILLRVGYFLSPWTIVVRPPPKRSPGYSFTSDAITTTYTYAFKPDTLRACLQVSRLWHQVLLPCLWEVFTDPFMNNLPSSRIDAISHHIRYLRLNDDSIDPNITSMRYVNELTELDIPRQGWNELEIMNLSGQQLQKQLVRTNTPRLKTLSWYGYGVAHEPAYLDPADFHNMERLTFLQLDHWYGGEGLLTRILLCVADTLQVLHLSEISDVSRKDFEIDEDAGNIDAYWTAMSSGCERQRQMRKLILPEVITLKLSMGGQRDAGLIDLISYCPKLEHLSLAPYSQGHATRAATLLREKYELGGQLQSLIIKNDSKKQDSGLDLCFDILQGCIPSASLTATTTMERANKQIGLTKIKLTAVPMVNDDESRLFASIALHANTLRSIKLKFTEYYGTIRQDSLRQLVCYCHNLEVLSIDLWKINFSIFQALGLKETGLWACRRLKTLSFMADRMPLVEEQYEDRRMQSLFTSWSMGFNKVTAGIRQKNITSPTIPTMGWYLYDSPVRSLDERTKLAAFKMVKDQKLEFLDVLVWCGVRYDRSEIKPAPKVKIIRGTAHPSLPRWRLLE